MTGGDGAAAGATGEAAPAQERAGTTASDPRPYRRGVGAMLMNDRGLVWVGQRLRKVGEQLDYPWQMPQGGLDDGEDPREAVRRELAEETGVVNAEIIAETEDWLSYDLPPEVSRRIWKGRFRGQAQKWFVLRFLGREAEIDLNAHDKPEFDAWRWVAMAGLPNLVVPFKRPMYARIVAELGRLAADAAARDTERDGAQA